MALGTVTLVKSGVHGDLKYAIVDVQPSSGANYTTGGETFGVAQVPGFTTQILQVDGCQAPSGKSATYNYATGKLMNFTGSAETASNTNLSGATESVRLCILGK